jgi:hypothetical protein
MCGIEDDQPSKFARCRGRDHLAAEASFDEERQSPAMIEMRVGEEHEIDGPGIEPERILVFFRKLAAALEHAAIDENAATRAFGFSWSACAQQFLESLSPFR